MVVIANCFWNSGGLSEKSFKNRISKSDKMATNKNCIRHFLWLIVFFNIAFAHANSEQIREQLSGVYLAEVGVREATGRNDGTRVEEYLASCGLKKGQPWCAAFVCWAFKQVGVRTVVSGYSPTWFPDGKRICLRNKYTKSQPLPGDVGGLYYPEMGRIAHTFFIHEWSEYGDAVITIEGNTNGAGSREGGGVYRKRRLKSQIYVVSRWIN